MIRKSISRIAAVASVALLLGAQAVSKADRLVNYAYYGNNGVYSYYSQLDVRNVNGVTDPDSWFFIWDGGDFYAYGNFDTVNFTKDADGTVHADLLGYGLEGDAGLPVYIKEQVIRHPNGATELSMQVMDASKPTALKSQTLVQAIATTPMVAGSSIFQPGK